MKRVHAEHVTLQEDVKEIARAVNALIEAVELLQAEGKPPQFPKVGDMFYRINSRGEILEQYWTDSQKQKDSMAFMGVFKTLDEAKAKRDKVLELSK